MWSIVNDVVIGIRNVKIYPYQRGKSDNFEHCRWLEIMKN